MTSNAIFLSAGVPDPVRGPEFASTADTIAIAAAVSALVQVVLGRRILVWGGHPAITPMIWAVAESLDLDYGRWVRLYQSKHFEDRYPEDNDRFQNVTFVESIAESREGSLEAMRKQMFLDNAFGAAVFIGGMRGVLDEFRMLSELQPDARPLPIYSTGGAARLLASNFPNLSGRLSDEFDYVALFHRYLSISPMERRYRTPDAQPPRLDDRIWRTDSRT